MGPTMEENGRTGECENVASGSIFAGKMGTAPRVATSGGVPRASRQVVLEEIPSHIVRNQSHDRRPC